MSTHQKLLNRIIFVLSLCGILIAGYLLQSYLRHSTLVCLNTGCEIVRQSSYSNLFGIPVPAYGLVGYGALAIVSFLRTFIEKKEILYGLLILGIGGFLLVMWFTWVELFLIKAICMWCTFSAINMTVIFLLTLRSFHLSQKRL